MSQIIPVKTFDLVLFGSTGDLAQRQIIPALYRRFHVRQMLDGSRIIGAARTQISESDFRSISEASIRQHVPPQSRDDALIEQFLAALTYVSVGNKNEDGWKTLAAKLRGNAVRVFYLSVGPAVFSSIILNLQDQGVITSASRVVIEKPFGRDLASAKRLNADLLCAFRETQIYRIDHYLGKETVQNLMALRFANVLFEPLWNHHFIDHVQITVAEKIGVKGRSEYYDSTGALRDMVQNHLMQLLCLVAMETPSAFTPDTVRDEKLKVIRALRPVEREDIVRAQYLGGLENNGYLEDVGNPDSRTESFIALKCEIANWRWAGTPFFLRSGKRLRERLSEIAVVFKRPLHSIFLDYDHLEENVLVIRLQPREAIQMQVTIKRPGPGGMRLTSVPLDMSFAEAVEPKLGPLTNAYERLIMDVVRGNQTLFMRNDEIEAAWEWTDSVIETMERQDVRMKDYDPGGDGPSASHMLLHVGKREWRKIKL